MTTARDGEEILPRPVEPGEAKALLHDMERVRRMTRSAWQASWIQIASFVALAVAVVILGYLGLDAVLTLAVRRPDVFFLDQPLGEFASAVYWTVAGLAVLALVARRSRRGHVAGSITPELLLGAAIVGLGFAVTVFSYQAYNHEYLAPSVFAAVLVALGAIEWRTGTGATALGITGAIAARRIGITAAAAATAGALAILGSILAAEASWAVGRVYLESLEGMSDLRQFLSHRGWPALFSAGAFLCIGGVLLALDRRRAR